MLTELLHQRRSQRSYLPEKPPLTWLKEIVRCGRTAPSPGNSQPVRVRWIDSESSRSRLQEALARRRETFLQKHAEKKGSKRIRNYIRVYYRYSEFMFTAPWLLMVGTVPTSPGFADHMTAAGLCSRSPSKQTDKDITVGLFVSAMLLKATELGLDSCVLTAPLVFLEEENTLPTFAHFTPKCFVTLGYGAKTPPKTSRLELASILERV